MFWFLWRWTLLFDYDMGYTAKWLLKDIKSLIELPMRLYKVDQHW